MKTNRDSWVPGDNDVQNMINKFICEASNTDDLVWEFSKDGGWKKTPANYTNTVNTFVNQGTTRRAELSITVTSFDNIREVTGHYRCVATSFNKLYRMRSAVYELVIPGKYFSYLSVTS